MSEKASKGMFLKPDKLQTDYYTVTNKKERRKRKSKEKRKKAMVAPLVFTIATFEIVLAEKTFGRKTLRGCPRKNR